MSVRLTRELKDMMSNCGLGISCFPRDDSMKILDADIVGPKDSPYENGTFKLEVNIPDRYPFDPPHLKFITKIYHPNIDDAGRICLDILKPAPQGKWKATLTIQGVLLAVQVLLSEPNSDDPLMPIIAHELQFNRKQFEQKAVEWTLKYAIQLTGKNVKRKTDPSSPDLKLAKKPK